MLADPCNAPLVPGLHGSDQGMLARFKSSYTLPSTGTDVNGWVLWCPIYNNSAPSENPGTQINVNIVGFCTAGTAQRPDNTIASPAYRGTTIFGSAADGFGIPDPANAFGASTTCQDSRVLSACVKLKYIGAMQSAAGEIAYLDNIPNELLLNSSGVDQPPTVDMLFNYSRKCERFGVQDHEIKYRPEPIYAQRFERPGTGGVLVGVQASEATRFSGYERSHEPTWFGFAWRGLPANAEQVIVEFTKNVEWRAEASLGIPAQLNYREHAEPPLEKALAELDRRNQHWSTTMTRAGAHLVDQAVEGLSELAFTGTASRLARRAVPLLLGL